MARSGRKKKPSKRKPAKPESVEAAAELKNGLQVWRPGVDPIQEGEELTCDPSAYNTLHAFRLGWPCLSFDILRDDLGALRHEFPLTMFCVAGTQAANSVDNAIIVAKLSSLSGRKRNPLRDAESSSEDSDTDSEDQDMMSRKDGGRKPNLQARLIAHRGCVNRIRAMPQSPNIVATWSETGHVQIWDVQNALRSLPAAEAGEKAQVIRQAPLKVFSGHSAEGFALDWSPVSPGWLASGDNSGTIHIWQPLPGFKWNVTRLPGCHASSVEDLQWSPVVDYVLCSCSADGTIVFWDTRSGSRLAETKLCDTDVTKLCDTDVNVISWNRLLGPSVRPLVVAGTDSGRLHLIQWDGQKLESVSYFGHHMPSPITSIEWSPHEDSMFAVTSADNTLTVWDASVEGDDDEMEELKEGAAAPPAGLPPQLLFVHQGQKELKEVHWHPQIPGLLVSTSFDGFNVFQPSNIANV